MPTPQSFVRWVLLVSLLFHQPPVSSYAGVCELSVLHRGTLYSFSLASPTPKYPHGVLSEDGFYKVAVNDTVLWFQPCDQMIFNHDQPKCFDCQECGCPLHCGMECSALASNDIGGYHVCNTIGRASKIDVALIDEINPNKGVTVKMSASGPKNNCSLSVSVFCDLNGAHGPDSLDILGTCNYATMLRHPSGCAKTISVDGNGLGWFGTLMVTVLCLLVAYIAAGAVYRFFFLGVRGPHIVPNLEFWLSLPQRLRSLLRNLVRRVRGIPRGSRSSYAPMNYS